MNGDDYMRIIKKALSLVGCAGLAFLNANCPMRAPDANNSKSSLVLEQRVSVSEPEKKAIAQLKKEFEDADHVYIGTYAHKEIMDDYTGRPATRYRIKDVLCAMINKCVVGELFRPMSAVIGGGNHFDYELKPAPYLWFSFPKQAKNSKGQAEPYDLGFEPGERAVWVSKLNPENMTMTYVSHYHFKDAEKILLQIVQEYEQK